MADDESLTRRSSVASTIPDNHLTEQTPLLERKQSRVSLIWKKSAVYRVLLTGFLVSLSFGVTQVPLIYVFGVMECEKYYTSHPSTGHGCRIHQIEANTARSVALLGASTTLFGVVNLFFTGWTMKAFGTKKALLLTTFFPAVRLMVQNIGVDAGGGPGIVIVQCSQIITMVGGPVGYLLALNSLAAEVVEPADRTATLGRLSGCAMFGTALGYLAGGFIGDIFGIIWPFRVTLILFVLCCLYVWFFLPDVHNKEIESKASKSLAGFFDPIKMFAPAKYIMPNTGRVYTEYGVLLLGIGVFLGVLATSYIPVLLQMYATDVFDFGTSENGVLISLNSLVRGLFLTFAFPLIISSGRKWLGGKPPNSTTTEDGSTIKQDPATTDSEPAAPPLPDDEAPPNPAEETETHPFDLAFTKYSLLLDGALTALSTFITSGTQMYAIALILPLASGTGPAAKGTIMQMCPPTQRTDALSAISLVELVARLMGTSVFGLVFAGLAEGGGQRWTFAVNGCVAAVGFGVLIGARFPRRGAGRWVKEEEGEEGDG